MSWRHAPSSSVFLALAALVFAVIGAQQVRAIVLQFEEGSFPDPVDDAEFAGVVSFESAGDLVFGGVTTTRFTLFSGQSAACSPACGLSISFEQPQADLSFALGSSIIDTQITIELTGFLGGVEVLRQSFSTQEAVGCPDPLPPCGQEALVEVDATFDELRVDPVPPGSTGFFLDNLRTTTAPPEPLPPPGPFQCYKAKDLKDPRFDPRDVTLADQFGAGTAAVKKPIMMCNPADKNGEGITDPVAHLCCYKIKGNKLPTPAEVETSDQFGDLRLRVKSPKMLCEPCTKAAAP